MKKKIHPPVLLLVATFFFHSLFAQPFNLLKDINPGSASGIGNLVGRNEPVSINNILYFAAYDGAQVGLWKSDGTAVGTSMVMDFSSASPQSFVNMGGVLYFIVTDTEPNDLSGLWRSDGTAAGTYLVKHNQISSTLQVAGNKLYFSTYQQFWTSDGTEGGTVVLKSVDAGSNGSVPSTVVALNGMAYFDMNDGVHGDELWRSDGTIAGTVQVTNVLANEFGYDITSIAAVNGTLFFITEEAGKGGGDLTLVNLWKSNGNLGNATKIKQLATSFDNVLVRGGLVASGNNIYFKKLFQYYRGSYIKAELWVSTGTAGGTKAIAEYANPDGATFVTLDFLTDVNGTLFFYAGDGTNDELWKSNGTAATTKLVKDIRPGGSSFVTNISHINGTVYFNANDGTHGSEIWKSNGSESGTVLVEDVVPGPGSSAYVGGGGCCGGAPIYTIPFTLSAGKIFAACLTPEFGTEFWTTTLDNCAVPTNRLYVNAAAASNGSGSSWQCAIKELRDAVAIANSNPAITEIWVAKGIYKPTAGSNREASITITNGGLKILGGFAGTETAAWQANPAANVTTVSGDIGVAGNMADNSYHLLRIEAGSPLLIDGLAFEKANANSPNQSTGDNFHGAALIISGNYTNATIRRCLFTANSASLGGAAMSIRESSIHIDSCLFTGNSAANGGAVAVYGGSLSVANSLFSENKATTGSGGAVFSAGYTNFSTRFFNTAFDRNTAAVNGGAYFQQLPSGGGSAGSTYYEQCVFSKNSAARGGATYQINNFWLINCTFFSNTASVSGGAMLVSCDPNYDNMYFLYNIFWKNKKGSAANVAGADILFTGSGFVENSNQQSISYNILQLNTSVPADNGGTVSGNLRGTDPLFVSEALPAGADGLFAYQSDGLELKNTSPAKNIGSYRDGSEPTDLLGRTRIVCGRMDLGPYENQTCSGLIVGENLEKAQEASVTNPFRNSLLIRYTGAEKADVEISSLTGQKVWKGSAIQKGQTQVNTATWPGGLYQVTIRSAGSKPIVLKVIKM